MPQWLEDIGSWFQTNLQTLLEAALILVGFVLAAYLVRWLIKKAIDSTGFAKKAAAAAEGDGKSVGLGQSIGSAAFWIIILIGLVQALDRLGLEQIVGPLNNMFETIFAYLPNLIGAALIFAVFLIVANVVKQAAKAVLVFTDPLPEKAGLASGPVDVSGVTSNILFALIAILGGIAAFDVLDIAAISGPANEMLSSIVSAIPRILLAVIILAIFYVIARFVSGLIRKTAPSLNLDEAVQSLGLLKGADKGVNMTSILSGLSLFFIMLLGLIQALRVLDFAPLTEAMTIVLDMGTQIVFGAIIIAAGVFIANLVANAMAATGSGATDTAAGVTKWVIIVLASILGISRMGLDPTGGQFILYAALALLAGGALAGGLAFGIGGRDWAAAQLEKLSSGSGAKKTTRSTRTRPSAKSTDSE
jgi:hypothetical protein